MQNVVEFVIGIIIIFKVKCHTYDYFNIILCLYVGKRMFFVPAEKQVLQFFNLPSEDQELLELQEEKENINFEEI